MRISDWSSDVCSSDLPNVIAWIAGHTHTHPRNAGAVTSKTFGGHAVACVVAPALYYVGMSAQDDDPLMTAYVTFYPDRVDVQIGRASCRERVCQDGEIRVGRGSLKKKTKDKKI